MHEVTAAGSTAARKWLHQPVARGRDVRSELLPKLALLDRAGTDPKELLSAQLAEFHPIAAAPEEQAWATSGFDPVLILAFYSRLFGAAPAKLRPGYANFAIDDPPLKLVLNCPGNGPGGTINHLGVEVSSAGEVTHAGERLAAVGLDTEPQPCAVCYYARQDKVWARDPDGLDREYYTVLEHIEAP